MKNEDMNTRDFGNLTSKTLVELGKEAVNNAYPNQDIDYGELPSRTLTNLGKQVLSQTDDENTL